MYLCISNLTLPTISQILEFVGIVSLIIAVIRIIWVVFSGGIEWIDNISVIEEDYDPQKDYQEPENGTYPVVFYDNEYSNEKYLTVTIIAPQQTMIRKLKIKRLDYNSVGRKRYKYILVKTVKQITPQRPLCMIVERGDLHATYMVEWHVDYGGKATYYFHENLRDGNNDCQGIEYHFGLWAKIRKLLDLK